MSSSSAPKDKKEKAKEPTPIQLSPFWENIAAYFPSIKTHHPLVYKEAAQKKIKKLKKYFPRVYIYMKPNIKLFVMCYLLNFFSTYLSMLNPKYVGSVIDIVSRTENYDDLINYIYYMLIFQLVLNIFNKWKGNITAKVTKEVGKSMKKEVYRKILEKDLYFHEKHSAGELSQALNNSTQMIQLFSVQQFMQPF